MLLLNPTQILIRKEERDEETFGTRIFICHLSDIFEYLFNLGYIRGGDAEYEFRFGHESDRSADRYV